MQLRKTKYAVVAILMLSCLEAVAQSTIESPYSRFGMGLLNNATLPKYKGMGGIGIGMNAPTAYSYINTQNPATFSSFALTTVDAGMTGTYTNLRKGNQSESSWNGTLSHFALGFPVTKWAGLNFGIMPYSQMGYNYQNTTKIDTVNANYIYAGEGGLSRAHLGLGVKVAEGFRVGATAEYIFGNMIRSKSSEILEINAIQVSNQDKDNIYGLSFSYGAQYDIDLSTKTKLIIGYTGTAPAKLSSKYTNTITRYTKDGEGNNNPALDTVQVNSKAVNKFSLPVTHGFGFSVQKYNNWVFGADVKFGNWSSLEIGGVNQGLKNTMIVGVGGQWTPDVMAVSNYFKRIDYRIGFNYNKSYINISGQDIDQKSVTLGLGLPFATVNRFTFSKMNIAAELGSRGTMANNLVKENFVNVHLGFTLNDKWFNRFKFD